MLHVLNDEARANLEQRMDERTRKDMAEIREKLDGMNCCGKQEEEYHQNCDGNETITQKVVDLLHEAKTVQEYLHES